VGDVGDVSDASDGEHTTENIHQCLSLAQIKDYTPSTPTLALNKE